VRRAPSYAPLFRGMLSCSLGHLALASGATVSARRHLEEAFGLATEGADMPFVADIGVAVAWLCWCRGDPEAAAGMLGTAHALRGSPDALSPDVARLVRHLTEVLGEVRYRRAYDERAGLDRAEALAGIAAGLLPGVAGNPVATP